MDKEGISLRVKELFEDSKRYNKKGGTPSRALRLNYSPNTYKYGIIFFNRGKINFRPRYPAYTVMAMSAATPIHISDFCHHIMRYTVLVVVTGYGLYLITDFIFLRLSASER